MVSARPMAKILCTPSLASVYLLWFSLAATSVQAGTPEKGLLAHWKLDEAPGQSVADSSGRFLGEIHGAAAGAVGKLAGAFAFDSDRDDYIDFGGAVQLGGNQATLAAIIKPQRFNPPDYSNEANSRNGILGSADADLIFTLTDLGRLAFVWDAGANDYQAITAEPSDAVPLDVFSHVAVTRSGSTMTLYVNGVRRASDGRFSDAPFQPFDRLQLGRVNGSPKRDFHGVIDDVRIYDRALSAEEVRELADACGLGGVPLPELPPERRQLERLRYNHPGLAADLGVGLWAWPLPMDYDGDGDIDLVVSCADKPYNAAVLFENPGGEAKMPVFKPAVILSKPSGNARVSIVGKEIRVTSPGNDYPDFLKTGFDRPRPMPLDPSIHKFPGKLRANEWTYVDYDGDGAFDLIVGIGDWSDYGWDNAYDESGNWKNGPLHGRVYLLRNEGDSAAPKYAAPVQLTAGGKPIDVYGMPSPCLADFDGDGDLDLVCGEFLDKMTWFENVGTRTRPEYAEGRFLLLDGEPLRMELCMISPVAVDFDRDGDIDLVVGQEDGRVALVDNTGEKIDRMPKFAAPVFFRQEAYELKFGALVTPVGFDWDGDGDQDIVSGNTAGHVAFIENLDGGNPPKWAEPKLLEAGGEVLRIMAGPNGSIQGPCEAKWGYTTLSVADWDHDGLPDLVVNSIWGKVVWYRNVGTRTSPKLAAAQPVEVEWTGPPPKPAWNWWNPRGKELVTQWRTTPVVVDFDADGLNDLVMLDHEGYLALFRRKRLGDRLVLSPPERVFYAKGASTFDSRQSPGAEKDGLLRLNSGEAGKSGRRKLCIVDYDGDGKLDILVNSSSANLLRQVSAANGRYVFQDMGPLDHRVLAGHDTSPTMVDWDGDGIADLLLGAEDGYFYFKKNTLAK